MLLRISTFYERLKNLIIQLIKYGIFVWKNGGDYDWDHHYLYNLIRWKLSNMASCIKLNDISIDSIRIVKQIEYAIYLIDRMQNDEDEDRARKLHEEKWGTRTILFGEEATYTLPSGEMVKGMGIASRYAGVSTLSDYQLADEELVETLIYSNEKKKDLKMRLFRHLDRYVETWWD